MKTLKYIFASLAIAVAIAGCAGGSGTTNLDSTHFNDTFYERDI